MDVTARRTIAREPERVAAYAMDWRHDHEWTQGIKRAELTSPAPGGGFGVGAEVTRTAYFLGRRIDYVLRVEAHEPPALLDMRSVAGPFPMHVTYRFDPAPEGTLASIRVRGGRYRLLDPVMGWFVRNNLRKDLRDLAEKVG
ncbi:SRPBCC family protein [Saccharothrix variisporea]|uniref:Polyketide cyclase/dehydrase/lipid transport protein n=1 Tax=Saccharothrix variisporea TaxID=543527 RepID=A0A495XJU9_9PSEU|nr:SRPBCC family protein [Saccharothrix variisporea]RKT73445.1 polyketide cyclase/dehydrase/lipid transport protein [Saccharothrix variisporea]